jgi:MFS family permease
VLVLGAVILRFATLDVQSFAHDESVTPTRVLMPGLGDTLQAVVDSERSGPVYYVLAWLWSKVFGMGEVGLRSLSAVVGALTIPVAYLIALELASRRAALLAASLAAVNPFLFWYSQHARSYGLYVLLSALALLFLVRAIRVPSARNLTGWVVSSVASLASHYFAVFLIVPEAVILLYARRDRRALMTVAVTALASLPCLALAERQQEGRSEGSELGGPLIERAAVTVVKFFNGYEPYLGPRFDGIELASGSAILAVIATVLIAIALVLLSRSGAYAERWAGSLMAGIAAFALFAPLLLAVVGLDLINDRNLIGGLLPLLVAAAIGLGARGTGRAGAAAAVLLALVFAAGVGGQILDGAQQRPDVRGLVSALGPGHSARAVIGPSRIDDPLLYYLGPDSTKAKAKIEVKNLCARVEEVVVVSELPFETRSPAPGFALVEQGDADGYHFYRYRAADAQQVDLSDITTGLEATVSEALSDPGLVGSVGPDVTVVADGPQPNRALLERRRTC